MRDCIIVSGLEVMACVGVTAAERAAAQRLRIWLRMEPGGGLSGLGDRIGNTVDYAAVSEAVRQEAEARPRQLIETLAEEIAVLLLGRYELLAAVEVEVRKYVLPGAEYAGVRLRRERG